MVIAGVACALIANRFYLQAQKYLNTSKAKDEAINVTRQAADSWKSLYDAEHGEYTKYRDQTHSERTVTNAKMIALTGENERLKMRTDLSPVLEFQRQQGEVNARVVKSLDVIVERLTRP